jgi:hypothetical protein
VIFIEQNFGPHFLSFPPPPRWRSAFRLRRQETPRALGARAAQGPPRGTLQGRINRRDIEFSLHV